MQEKELLGKRKGERTEDRASGVLARGQQELGKGSSCYLFIPQDALAPTPPLPQQTDRKETKHA